MLKKDEFVIIFLASIGIFSNLTLKYVFEKVSKTTDILFLRNSIGGKMKIRTIDIAMTGILCALIAALALIPYVGFIPIIPGVISLALVLIPVVIGAQTQNVYVAVFISTFFGVMSLVNAYIRPTELTAVCFQNPLVSIVPRIFIGLTTYYSYVGFKKLFENSTNKFVRNYLPSGISAGIGVLTNAVLVLSLMWLIYGGTSLGDAVVVNFQFIGTIFLTNTLIEFVGLILIIPPVINVLKKYIRNL